MSVKHHHIYTLSFQSTSWPFNKAICQSTITTSTHSALCKSTIIEYIYIQYSVVQHTIQQSSISVNHHCICTFSFMSVLYHHIYTFSFQSTNQPFSKAICRPTIVVSVHSALNQPRNHSTECVSYPSSQICTQFLFNHLTIKNICQPTITASIHSALCQSTIIVYIHSTFRQPTNHSPKLYVSQSPLHIHIQFSVNQQPIRQSNMSGNHHCNYTFSFMSVLYQSTIIAYIHSAFSQLISHLTKQYVG